MEVKNGVLEDELLVSKGFCFSSSMIVGHHDFIVTPLLLFEMVLEMVNVIVRFFSPDALTSDQNSPFGVWSIYMYIPNWYCTDRNYR